MISPNQSNIYNDNKKKKSTRSVSFAETDGDYSGGEDEADGDSSSSENNDCSSSENDDSSTSSDGSGDSWNHLLLWCSSFYLLNEVLLVWSPEVHILLLNYRVCANEIHNLVILFRSMILSARPLSDGLSWCWNDPRPCSSRFEYFYALSALCVLWYFRIFNRWEDAWSTVKLVYIFRSPP